MKNHIKQIILRIHELLSSTPLADLRKYRRKHSGCTTAFAFNYALMDGKWCQCWMAFFEDKKCIGWQTGGDAQQTSVRQLRLSEHDFLAFLDSLDFWNFEHNPTYYIDAPNLWVAITTHRREKWIDLGCPTIDQSINNGKHNRWSRLLSGIEGFARHTLTASTKEDQ